MKNLTTLMVVLTLFATIVSCGGNNGNEKPIGAAISATPATLECNDKGGDKTFMLNASGAWTISDVPAFATVTPLKGVAGDNITVTVTFKANTTDKTLDGELKATLDDNAAKSAVIKLSSLGIGAEPTALDYANIQNYMVDVEGGTYEMSTEGVEGNTLAELDENGDDPYHIRHQVTLDSYMICKYEMTQETWKRIMGTEPYTNGGTSPNPETNPSSKPIKSVQVDGGPVCYINWIEMIEFCNKLSTDQGLEPYYKIEGNSASIIDPKGKGYRLPTESEWEYAARGGNKTNGLDFPGFTDYTELDEYAVTAINCGGLLNKVGGKKPNELGLYDMAGNVWEHVYDWYGKYPTSAVTNPTGPTTGNLSVLRGASWYGEAKDNSTSWSFMCSPRFTIGRAYGDDDQGFRIARYK